LTNTWNETSVGAILIEDNSPRMAGRLAVESAPYMGNWSLVKAVDRLVLDDSIHASRWNFFFIAEEVKAMFFGTIGEAKVRKALRRILAKVKQQNFNCLEVTAIVPRRFLGLPYTTLAAHSRHIQQSCHLESIETRRNNRRHAEWATG